MTSELKHLCLAGRHPAGSRGGRKRPKSGKVAVFAGPARTSLGPFSAPKWSRRAQWVSTNWPDRVGAGGGGLLRFGAAAPAELCPLARDLKSLHCRKPFECVHHSSGALLPSVLAAQASKCTRRQKCGQWWGTLEGQFYLKKVFRQDHNNWRLTSQDLRAVVDFCVPRSHPR